jgi:(1->4)-alpha-D-glucan 1-alpha-D-glucosylmutase
MQAYAVKAAREGKEQTSWLTPNEAYESGLGDFLATILDRARSTAFLDSFEAIARRAALLGALSSLTQITLKATMPGVPDFYQGAESWDLSLVDPDNRRPVDFAARSAWLAQVGENTDWAALVAEWQNGRIKLALTRRLLAIRNRFGTVFTNGNYRPLQLTGAHADETVAFTRSQGRDIIIVVAARTFGRATEYGRAWPSPDTLPQVTIKLGGVFSVQSLLAPLAPTQAAELPVSPFLANLPVAILHAEPVKGRKPHLLAATT